MSRSPHLSLQHAEAIERFDPLEVLCDDVALDLDRDEATSGSVTTIRFRSRGGATFMDLKPLRVNAIGLNGLALDVDSLDRGRVRLETPAGENELVVGWLADEVRRRTAALQPTRARVSGSL